MYEACLDALSVGFEQAPSASAAVLIAIMVTSFFKIIPPKYLAFNVNQGWTLSY